MTIPLSDKFAGLQPCTRKTPSLSLDAPQDTKEFTHEGVQLAYSPTTSREYHGEYGYYDKSQLRRAIAAECARMGGDV